MCRYSKNPGLKNLVVLTKNVLNYEFKRLLTFFIKILLYRLFTIYCNSVDNQVLSRNLQFQIPTKSKVQHSY